jgi:xylulose-5-phosphate/fructose-6-phosphate phosphoketolase
MSKTPLQFPSEAVFPAQANAATRSPTDTEVMKWVSPNLEVVATRRVIPNPPLRLDAHELDSLHRWWRAANYLSVGQIYLCANPLLREPLQRAHVKKRLLGHWGTTPGLNFIYAHINRVICREDVSAIFLAGPGHGGPAVVASAYLDGTYSEVYPNVSQDEDGLKLLFRQFSFPGGIPSHAAPETPGSMHEGGELGYVLSHAFGAAFDNPDLVVAAVVGDGEAETGPLATSWHGNKFLNPRRDGAVLPILHLNGYKIANPTILASIPAHELDQLLRGCGWNPIWVEGSDPADMHVQMARAMDQAFAEIATIQHAARSVEPSMNHVESSFGFESNKRTYEWDEMQQNGRTDEARGVEHPDEHPGRAHDVQGSSICDDGPGRTERNRTRPIWPMIVLRSPKGWTGPHEVDGVAVEGSWRSHQVPLTHFETDEHVALLEQWLQSYRPDELFDSQGHPYPETVAIAPVGPKRMSANPHSNGGLLLRDLHLPDFRRHMPDLAVRFINVVDLMRIQDPTEHPHGLSPAAFDQLFPPGTPIIFAFHGYPWLIHRLTYRRGAHGNLHVRGYKENGTTTTPFDMTVRNDIDRFHLVMDVIDRVPALGVAAAPLRQFMMDERARHRRYIVEHGEDLPEIQAWRWS